MAKSFLRSGNLDAVLPLGESGQLVYLSALQLRETLRLRKQQQIADCLAIPQPNDAGDRLDWYSPVAGKVISWAAASESARRHALNQLMACQQSVADICQRAQLSEKPAQKLFGALLAKALQFPDQNFVYLVGGKPVLTFWGFVSLEKKSRQDALDCLRIEEEDEPPLVLSKLPPIAAAVASVPPAAAPDPIPETVIPAPSLATAERTVKVPPAARKRLLRYGWILPAGALLIATGIQLQSYVLHEPEPETTTTKAAETPVAPSDVAASLAKLPAFDLPVAPATVTPAAKAIADTEPLAAASAPAAPVGKDDLVMPADAVRLGSTKFLNGNWRVNVDIKNPLTGKPPILRYQIKNGKGIAQMTHGDGINCRVEVYAGLMKSGNLVINSRTKAKCSDGSRYQMPELVCKPGSGPAECSGQYDANTVLPMTMKRESK